MATGPPSEMRNTSMGTSRKLSTMYTTANHRYLQEGVHLSNSVEGENRFRDKIKRI